MLAVVVVVVVLLPMLPQRGRLVEELCINCGFVIRAWFAGDRLFTALLDNDL